MLKRQRGIAQGWLYLIYLVVIVAVWAAAVTAWHSYTDGIDKKGYERGVQETTAAYAKRDNEALRAKTDRIKALEDQAREDAAKAAQQMDEIAKLTEKDRQHAREIHDRDVAAAHRGTLVLRDPGATACPRIGSGSETAAVAAGAGGSDGPASGQLSRAVTANLFALVDDADELAGQLARAQAVIVKDRELCK